jgi:hypothetical protein
MSMSLFENVKLYHWFSLLPICPSFARDFGALNHLIAVFDLIRLPLSVVICFACDLRFVFFT